MSEKKKFTYMDWLCYRLVCNPLRVGICHRGTGSRVFYKVWGNWLGYTIPFHGDIGSYGVYCSGILQTQQYT